MTFAPTTVDLSRMPAPNAIEPLDPVRLKTDFLTRFVAFWDEERGRDASLPAFEVAGLEANPASIFAKAWAYLRLMDRARVNDAVRAVLAPLASGADLDNIVARQGIQRLIVVPANIALNTPAVLETDAALLRRYLLSFDRPSAGSAGRYLYEVFRVFPLAGDAKVNGRIVHGRPGDTDVVIVGPGGRDATTEEMAAVRAAVLDPSVQPEAVGVSVLRATRLEYVVSLVIEVPPGPDAALLVAETASRVRAATDERTLIGGEIPPGLLPGAAYGPNVIKVRDLVPVVVLPNPYTVPVCTSITVTAEVRA
ncbi:baseplate J/gp47 family protein [Terrihabitans rhizophilus]|uniref:Baseplate J/gp47 family protein n=1 Tax=Terrihabitans rhizophilus TaxID=3092662 RepID=A0ABU4RNB1_9HYPH|nr:baseplate J/gp47 family protein [Terrihabitans sp. PJ23]MDX6806312.1 baseplate J/gp47 family protein [Terrihabitans sp. PJ23]